MKEHTDSQEGRDTDRKRHRPVKTYLGKDIDGHIHRYTETYRL